MEWPTPRDFPCRAWVALFTVPPFRNFSYMTPNSYQRFFAELKRRRVFRVIAVYGAAAFAIIEAADAILPRLALPDWSVTLVIWVALLGLPVAIVLTWALEVTPEGFRRTADATPSELTEIITAPALKRWSAGVFALVGTRWEPPTGLRPASRTRGP